MSNYGKFFLSKDAGDRLCDMHDGFQDFTLKTDGFRLISHVKIRNDQASAAISATLSGVSRCRVACNKILYLMGATSSEIVAMYSWDNRYLGIVTFSIDD